MLFCIYSISDDQACSEQTTNHRQQESYRRDSQEKGYSIGKEDSLKRHWRKSSVGTKLSNGEWIQNNVQFTVMSYNVLADHLMKRHSNLYSQSIDVLEWNERWARILKEIEAYNPDILCCQEVQYSHFHTHFAPSLSALNFVGVYKKRTGEKEDGCAIFYKKDKFILEDISHLEYHQPYIQTLNRDNIALFAKFRPRHLPSHDKRYSHQQISDTAVKNNDDCTTCDSFVVATTHLLYNPKREDVRLAQIALMFAELDRFAFKSRIDLESSPPQSRQEYFYPCIVTGDFNTNPDSPAYSFVTNGHLAYAGLFSRLRGPILPMSLGVIDACQHLNTVLSRCSTLLTANSEQERLKDKSQLTNLIQCRTDAIFTHELSR